MKILKYKKIRNKYKVYFDNDTDIDLYEDIILKYNLLLKKEISDKDLEKIKEDNVKEEIFDISLKYISVKMRTKKEIRLYLKKKKYLDKEIDEVIKRLENNKLIDDEMYIKAYISDKINLSTDGPYKIKNNLLKENFNENIIDKYLNEIDKEAIKNKLEKQINKKIKSIKNCSGNILKYKVSSYFLNLGYEKDMIEDILSSVVIDNTDQGIKEYKKLYEKYKNKYSEEKLEYVIKQKLYLKGFDLDEIKRNIN